MPPDGTERLTFVATAHAAALLHDRVDLDLRVAPAHGDDTSQHVRVLLATPLDRVRGTPPVDQARIAVLEDVTAPFDDTRFDDCVFRSASRPEIEFRALRALRRKAPAPIVLQPSSLEVSGRSVALSLTEHRLLARLLARPGAPVTRAELELAIGDAPTETDRAAGRALDAHVYRLRRKLRAVPGIRLETLRQRGFSLVLEPVDHSR
jgi:hypothetical protein